MTRRKQGGNAGGVQDAVVVGICGDGRGRLHVLGVLRKRRHGRAGGAALLRRHLAEIADGDVAGFKRELVLADFRQPRRQLVDGVLGDRPAGMAAGIGHFQCVVLREFLCRLHFHDQRLAGIVILAAAAFVDGELRINQVAFMRRQPACAVEGGAGLLAAGQRHLDGAGVFELLFLQPHHGVHPGSSLGFHVGGAAAIEIAAFLDELERIAGPVGALGLHHVNMAQKQDRLQVRIGARQHRHDAALLGMIRRAEQVNIVRRIARLLQMAGDLFRQGRAAA